MVPQRDEFACRRGGTCAIGDIGPGGGVVFYAASTVQSWGQYLEIAPQNWAGMRSTGSRAGLCSKTVGITGNFVDAIGSGKANSEILRQQCAPSTNCNQCGIIEISYRGNGKSDWYAPSATEAKAFVTNLVRTGKDSMSDALIVTSNVVNDKFVVVGNDGNGYNFGAFDNSSRNYVLMPHRPIRAFRPLTCREGGFCNLGDTGPGGGTIFYIGEFTNTATNEVQHYLELAPASWRSPSDPLAPWACNKTTIAGAKGFAVGTGEKNTSDVLAACTSTSIASRLARDYRGGGKDDWSLPSWREMMQLCLWASGQNRENDECIVRRFGMPTSQARVRSDLDWGGKIYWTSTQSTNWAGSAMTVTMSTQNPSAFDNDNPWYVSVRPIRAF